MKGKGYVVYSLPIAERIICLISGFSRKTDSARFNIKKSPILFSFNARHCLFDLLLLLSISPSVDIAPEHALHEPPQGSQ